ncbi:MAG: hypothetical protein DMG50_08675 [Acidobacteria bacterium]|nr:MAG: hypothetical protein DMG50_08675 [Acidobacteriota bacterium]
MEPNGSFASIPKGLVGTLAWGEHHTSKCHRAGPACCNEWLHTCAALIERQNYISLALQEQADHLII